MTFKKRKMKNYLFSGILFLLPAFMNAQNQLVQRTDDNIDSTFHRTLDSLSRLTGKKAKGYSVFKGGNIAYEYKMFYEENNTMKDTILMIKYQQSKDTLHKPKYASSKSIDIEPLFLKDVFSRCIHTNRYFTLKNNLYYIKKDYFIRDKSIYALRKFSLT